MEPVPADTAIKTAHLTQQAFEAELDLRIKLWSQQFTV